MDASGDVLSVLPMADIKADVFYTITQEVPDKKIEQIDTGNVIRSKKIMLNNMVIYNQNIAVSFPSYRASEEISVLTDRNFLPIKYVNYVYYETKFIEIDDYFISNKTQILEQLAQKTRQLVDEYDIIKEEYVNVFSVAGINRITHTIIVNKSIC